MILDAIKLSGISSYLRAANEVNLGAPDAGPPVSKTGTHAAVGKDTLLEVSGIFIQIEGVDLLPLFQRQTEPLITIDVVKEMFPGLEKDPYKHRVHTIGGYEDFNRSETTNLRVMEVDGFPTLVSLGNRPVKWRSPIYRFSAPFTVDSAAWHLPASKLTPKEGFTYDLTLRFWKSTDPLNQPAPNTMVLAPPNTTPSAGRFAAGLEDRASDIVAYQLELNATVKHDTYLKERSVGDDDSRTLGRPLLRTVSLLEMTAPRFEFHSLHELIAASALHQMFDERGEKLKKLNAALYVSAALEEGESVSITVNNAAIPAAQKLTYVDAKLAAEIKVRPPVLEDS